MYAKYMGKLFDAEMIESEKIMLYSDIKEEGFQNYTDTWGKTYSDSFFKQVKGTDLDYLYEIDYEIKYKGQFFELFSNFKKLFIEEDSFHIGTASFEVGKNLEFKRIDKFYWTKKISRKDIEVFKIVERPLGPFSSQGVKTITLEGQDIDDYFISMIEW